MNISAIFTDRYCYYMNECEKSETQYWIHFAYFKGQYSMTHQKWIFLDIIAQLISLGNLMF